MPWYRSNVGIRFQIVVLSYRIDFVRSSPFGTVNELNFWSGSTALYFVLSFRLAFHYSLMKLMGATSSISFCKCNTRIPLSVVLYVWPPSYSIKPFSTKSVKYSFSWLKDRYALYINFVLVAPPPFAASKSSPTMSLLLLYFIFQYRDSN